MKKHLCITMLLLFTGMAAMSQGPGAAIVTSRSNIKQGSIAKYTPAEGLVITFNSTGMTATDKAALATRKFEVYEDIVLSDAECKALKVTKGFRIKKGLYQIIKKNGIDTAKPGFAIKVNGIK